MSVEYDLVVVGSSQVGIHAAAVAAKLQARVALVTQTDRKYLPNDTLLNCSLAEIENFNSAISRDIFDPSQQDFNPILQQNTAAWIDRLNDAANNLNSLSNLAALGVDVIGGKGEFYRLPQLGLQVKERRLRSRRFLLATGSNFSLDFLEDNTWQSCLTLRDLNNKNLVDLPQELIIIGSDPIALALAQTLAKLGKNIILAVKNQTILPQEDREISNLIQAELEAVGVKIFTNSIVSQIKIIDNQKWLQAGDRALVADEIIIADYRQPNIANLNLKGVGVKYNDQRVFVDRQLTTTNPKIYACGDLIGGYALGNIARYEANIILKNTLFFPWYKTNYHTIPWAILTQPNLARVGLNEIKAKQQNSGKVYVVRQYFNQTISGQINNSNPGLLKLLIGDRGTILGCSIVGDRAAELISIPAQMMQHKIKLDSNPMRGLTSITIPTVYPSLTEIFELAIANYYQQKIQDNPRLIERLRSWFALRRK